MFPYSISIASTAKNASGTHILLFAESSKVLSNHCVEAVIAGSCDNTITCLDSEFILSLLIGFLLYAIADDPICPFSNGSSNSFSCCNNLMSFANLEALCAIADNTFSTLVSNFLVYVCPDTA